MIGPSDLLHSSPAPHFKTFQDTPTNVLFIKLDKVLKFTLKITLTCSYMFRSRTIIREPLLEPSLSYVLDKIRLKNQVIMCYGVVYQHVIRVVCVHTTHV